MATAVIFAKERECARRKELYLRQKDHERLVADVLKSYDKGHTGSLSFDELKAWLTSIEQGVTPSESECKWVMRMAIDRTPGLDMPNDLMEAFVPAKYFGRAAESWLAYKETQGEINAVFKKFDTDDSGWLDRDQLKQVLTTLNAGGAPAEQEVDYVLKRADVIGSGNITKPELAMAISLWYTLEEKHEKSRSSFAGAHAIAAAASGGSDHHKKGSHKKMEAHLEGEEGKEQAAGGEAGKDAEGVPSKPQEGQTGDKVAAKGA
eukprot:CAMPEP_0173394002 /NCGR_PEP_ID=MMETSP1356-20130122/23978_1 /TAXON_ID=77927 ORGANISM="Hemiselmis virescens, Strain PCC157" /NCGR_SAMPLE_ID=MMETSP1356 /ASSEMBLY_ACC=CAM_ASM_000847 /LENGTH=262 /DNA_ID=CAMNT_0014352151 /DNA_START=92 /DNA_END=877 /DNA_ORIENTATION=-